MWRRKSTHIYQWPLSVKNKIIFKLLNDGFIAGTLENYKVTDKAFNAIEPKGPAESPLETEYDLRKEGMEYITINAAEAAFILKNRDDYDFVSVNRWSGAVQSQNKPLNSDETLYIRSKQWLEERNKKLHKQLVTETVNQNLAWCITQICGFDMNISNDALRALTSPGPFSSKITVDSFDPESSIKNVEKNVQSAIRELIALRAVAACIKLIGGIETFRIKSREFIEQALSKQDHNVVA